MKTIFIILITSSFGHLFSQQKMDIEKHVKTVDSLYANNKLFKKEYPGRTFAGSLIGYYYNDTLVYVNTLTDGEYGGIETKYYVKDTILYKLFRAKASFSSPDEWDGYYKKHKADKNCEDCHKTKKCDKTIIIFTNPLSMVSIIKGKPQSLTPAAKLADQFNTTKTFLSLRTLLSKV